MTVGTSLSATSARPSVTSSSWLNASPETGIDLNVGFVPQSRPVFQRAPFLYIGPKNWGIDNKTPNQERYNPHSNGEAELSRSRPRFVFWVDPSPRTAPCSARSSLRSRPE